VCVADLDFSRGDVARALDLDPRDGLQPLVDHLGAWDADLLRHALAEHPSGARALLQPYDLSSILRLEREDFERLLAGLRESHPLVVADCGAQLDLNTITALSAADRILLVAHGTVPALRNVQRLLALLDRLNLPLERVALVVNAHQPRDLEVTEIERHLEFTVTAVLPHEPACREVDAKGGELSTFAPKSPLVHGLTRLAVDLGLVQDAAPGEPGSGRRMFSWGRR
jgi:Flp pilus assembly CpaE family ATPase